METAQISSDSHPEIGRQRSDRHPLIALQLALQFHGWFVPISLKLVLGIVAAYVVATA